MKKINVGIIGASGYTASELIRLVNNHPAISIKFLVGNTKAGKSIDEIYSHLKFSNLPPIKTLQEVNFSEIEAVFCCLPHGETIKIISQIPDNIKIIDLSSDFRIQDPKLYETFYSTPQKHNYREKTTYGLSEMLTNDIKKKYIISCPGCYPTSILLPLIPIKHLISTDKIIIDSKTGISGAGRKIVEQNLFCEINENFIPYNITKHRHLAEIIEQLGIELDNIQFTPQILPVSRGILSVIYVESHNNVNEIKKHLTSFYEDKEFVKINQNNEIPTLRNVTGTNFCEISVLSSNIPNQLIIFSAIDNLTKGSSGQALQNFNILFSLAENTGLKNLAIYP